LRRDDETDEYREWEEAEREGEEEEEEEGEEKHNERRKAMIHWVTGKKEDKIEAADLFEHKADPFTDESSEEI